MGSLLAAGVLINYIDRISVSVAGPQLESSFHLPPVELGTLFSAFFWSYALLQIPVGLVLDRLGVTRVGRWSAFLWSAAQVLTACAPQHPHVRGFRGHPVGVRLRRRPLRGRLAD